MTWTSEKIKQLKKLWQTGKSTVEIGKALGISKNAVVGKVHRLELQARPSPIKRVTETKAQTTVKEKKQKKQGSSFVTLLDLKLTSCRWPIGDPKDDDFHFCGEDTVTGKPYCTEHCKIAYTSLRELTMQKKEAAVEPKEAAVEPKEKTEKKTAVKEPKKEPVKKAAEKPEKKAPAKKTTKKGK